MGEQVAGLARLVAAQHLQAVEQPLELADGGALAVVDGTAGDQPGAQLLAPLLVAAQARRHGIMRQQRVAEREDADEDEHAGEDGDRRLVQRHETEVEAWRGHMSNFTILVMMPTPRLSMPAATISM